MNQEFDDISEDALKDDETLVKFLRGELSADEEAVFVKKLNDNPDLKKRAVAVAHLIKGLERNGARKNEELKSAFQKLSADDVKKLSRPAGKIFSIKKFVTWALSAAAVLCFVFGLRIFYVNSSNEKLAAEYQNEFPFSVGSRGGDDDVEQELKLLFDNVLQGKDLDLTIEKLSAVFDESCKSELSDGYNKYANFLEVSGWYLALAHLKNHDGDKAKTVLSELIRMSDKALVSDKANELIVKIK